jgi:hypothetical protein
VATQPILRSVRHSRERAALVAQVWPEAVAPKSGPVFTNFFWYLQMPPATHTLRRKPVLARSPESHVAAEAFLDSPRVRTFAPEMPNFKKRDGGSGMRKSLWIILTVLVLAVGAPIAHADSFEPFFTTMGCVGVCALPTATDVVFPAPTTMDVTFDGVSAEVSIPSGDESTDDYAWYASVVGSSLNFLLIDTVGPGIPDGCQGYTGCGTLSFAPVSTPTSPEPSSGVLMLLGVVLVLRLRRRNSRGHQMAT